MLFITIMEIKMLFPLRNWHSACGFKRQHVFCFSDTEVLQRFLRARLQPVSRRLLESVFGERPGDINCFMNAELGLS